MGIRPQQASLGWCIGEQDWVAATGSRALEDSWTSGKGVEALAGGCFDPIRTQNGDTGPANRAFPFGMGDLI